MNRCIKFVLLLLVSAVLKSGAQGTAFNYQGRLNDAGAPANAAYDFQFTVYNAVTNGSPVSASVTNSAVAVSNGLFSVTLDFGAGIFTGTNYWLDIGVRAVGVTNFTGLSPRQPVLPVPYAIFANGASNLFGTLAATQLTGTLPSAQVAGNYSGQVNFPNATNSFSGAFVGNGALLTNLNGSQLTAGTVADARLSTNVALLNTNQTFTGVNNFASPGNSFSGVFAGNGAALANLNGSQVTAGTVADARLTTNVALLNASQTYTGSNTYNGANNFSGANSFTNSANTFVGSFFGNGLVGWIPAYGATVQAVSDTGYLLLNPQFTTVMLPSAPNLGDIVRISGAGAGGWRVGQGTNQSVIGNFVSYRNSIWTLASSGSWRCLAASSAGARMYAGLGTGGGIYSSTDYGHTWGTTSATGSGWSGLACSADGSRVYGFPSGGNIQYSTNSGTSWISVANSKLSWVAAACSADGSKILAAVKAGSLYLSTNSGAAWNTVGPGSFNWSAVAASADGTHFAAAISGGNIYISANSGVGWSGAAPTALWSDLAMSADGLKLAATIYGNTIYLSTNSGVAWTNSAAPVNNWSCLTATADCTRLVAAVSNGLFYASMNFGASWSVLAGSTNQPWSALAGSADGSRLAAASSGSGGGLYYSGGAVQAASLTGTNGFITGSQGAAVELQYIGNSQFMPVSATGTLWAN